MKSVAFVHGISAIGGAERELLVYLDRLPAKGYRSIVIGPGEGPLADEVKRRGLPLHRCEFPPWRKASSIFSRRSGSKELRALLNDYGPAIIHVNDIWWLPQVLQARGKSRLPVAVHVRQEIEPGKARQYRLQDADAVLAVSRRIEQTIRQAGINEAVHTIYSGVACDLAETRGGPDTVRSRWSIPSDAVLLGTVANVFPRKGYEVMLEALSIVAQDNLRVHYLIVGTGDRSYEGLLRTKVEALGLAHQVHFAGFQEAVGEYLHVVDLYVQPSLMEGFGIAVIEAMARGKAVVGTRTGGLPEVIVHEETGLLVPPNDAAALAGAINILLKNHDLRRRYGETGKERARKVFTVEAMMEKLTSVYELLLNRRSKGEPV